jgi:hypothetical protein
MRCALERKESRKTLRDNFIRVDYPEENEEMNKMLVLRLIDGKHAFQWRDPRPIS